MVDWVLFWKDNFFENGIAWLREKKVPAVFPHTEFANVFSKFVFGGFRVQ